MKSQEEFVIISRKNAKSQGLVRYFTGMPCPQGHISPRNVGNYSCLMCQREHYNNNKEKRKEYYQKNRKSIIENQTARDLLRKDEIRDYQKKYRAETTEKRLQYHKIYYQENRGDQLEKSREHRIKNKEYYKKLNKEYYEKNRDEILIKSRANGKAYYEKHKEKINKRVLERYHTTDELFIKQRKATRRKYRNSAHGRSVINAHGANRRAVKINAMPMWYEHEKCKEMYTESIALTKSTGIQHHVDHIVPLRNKLVCGLHCIDNLQILTAEENMKKGNKFIIE